MPPKFILSHYPIACYCMLLVLEHPAGKVCHFSCTSQMEEWLAYAVAKPAAELFICHLEVVRCSVFVGEE